MKLDYMVCWNDAMAMLGANKEAVAAIAGVFLFLPSLVWAYFVGEPPIEGLTDAAEIQAAQFAFLADNAFGLMASNLVVGFGSLSLYVLLAPNRRDTVGDVLKAALGLFLFFLIANIIVAFGMLLGFFLFIIPGLYLLGRFSLVPMVIADQEERNPIEAIKKNWELTKGNGWSILLFLVMIILVGGITVLVAGLVVGLIVGLASGGAGWPFFENLFTSALGAAFQVILIAVIAAIYRQLSGKTQDVEDVFS
jgi:hypothetical protein